MKTFLILLYLWSGQLRLDQTPMESVEECQMRGSAIVEEQQKDPRFGGGLFAGCVSLPAQEVKR